MINKKQEEVYNYHMYTDFPNFHTFVTFGKENSITLNMEGFDTNEVVKFIDRYPKTYGPFLDQLIHKGLDI